ncbi:hypothetical protein ACI65C_003698 [Semiaphis heraclei]
MTFYVPHWIWKIWEGGKIRMITNGMRGFCEGPVKTRRLKQDRLWSHRHWALRVCDDSLDVTSLLIVVSILRMDDVSATPDPEEGHPTDLPRSPPPPPGSYSYSVPPSSFPTSR